MVGTEKHCWGGMFYLRLCRKHGGQEYRTVPEPVEAGGLVAGRGVSSLAANEGRLPLLQKPAQRMMTETLY